MPVQDESLSKKESLSGHPAEADRLASASEGREELLDLVRRLPDEDVPTAKRLLQALIVDPLWLSLQAAPVEEEELSDSAIESLRRGRDELERGKTVSHEEVLREFGL